MQRKAATSTQAITYVYDNANCLSSVNGQNYTWDNNGNLINDGSANYLYDRANRLISTTLSGTTSLFNYNGDGSPWDSTMPSFRLWRSLTSRSGTALLDLHYGYDAVGNINHILNPTAGEDLWYTYARL